METEPLRNPYTSRCSVFPLRTYIGNGTFTYIVYVMCILKTWSFAYTRIIHMFTYITYMFIVFLSLFSYILSFIILYSITIIVLI